MTSKNVHSLLQDAQSEGMSNKATSILVENLNALTIAGSQGATLEEIAGDEVTLFCVVLDETGSMLEHQNEVVSAYNQMLQALSESKMADSILLSTWLFDTSSRLFHGFLPLDRAPDLATSDYQPADLTALFDATLSAFTAIVAYGQDLRNNGVRTKIVVVVFSDGEDNRSRHTSRDVYAVSSDLTRQECILALVAFGEGFARQTASEMGFPNVLEVSATPSGIRRAVGTVSKSVIRVSQTRVGPDASKSFFS